MWVPETEPGSSARATVLLTTALFLQPRSADFKTIPGHGGVRAIAGLEVGSLGLLWDSVSVSQR